MFGIEPLICDARSWDAPVRACCRADRRAIRWAGESHPVGVPGSGVAGNPGLRCAAPWAIESGPVGAGGLRLPIAALRRRAGSRGRFAACACRAKRRHAIRGHHVRQHISTEGATFDSPGRSPGFSCRAAAPALKGRDSPPTTPRVGNARCIAAERDAAVCATGAPTNIARFNSAGESHPVGVPGLRVAGNPGLRCAAPWAIE